ncbi:LysE family translocator [uncultured Aquimarina sp.]|uniref:LysE family translocator n=1 Tax=uncultured Aquimarina sp. TaxID=575652 RepID=UPI00261F3D00|nr:LysE family translocator [uncultured Aquimarina sp.]
MNGIENYLGFLLAGIIMNLTPGADSIYIITRSIAQGKKAGIYSVLGIGSGAIVHIVLAAFGLSAVLAKSIILFNIVKWAGATYLIYLGIKMLMDKSDLFDKEKTEFDKVSVKKIYRQGFLTNVLNPKVAIFFLSLLPQFIKPEYVNSSIPFLILGGTFLFTGTVWCLFLAYSASFMTDTFRKNDRIGKIMKKVSGFVFIGLGLQLLIKRN